MFSDILPRREGFDANRMSITQEKRSNLSSEYLILSFIQ